MGTAQNIGGHSGASSSSLHVPPPAGDALIPVQQALSSVLTGTAQNIPRGTRAQVPRVTGDVLSPRGTRAQVSAVIVPAGTAQNIPRDTRASLSQVPPENANAPVQHPLSKTKIFILGTLVEMKTEITIKQDQLMAEGHTRDEQEDQGQELPDSRRQ